MLFLSGLAVGSIVVFLGGFLANSRRPLVTGHTAGVLDMQGLGSRIPCTGNWHPQAVQNNSTVTTTGTMSLESPAAAFKAKVAEQRHYAYVMMAYDEPGQPMQYIWRAMAMARALQRLSNYRVVLLTNTTELPDGTNVAESFRRLNVEVLSMDSVPVPEWIERKSIGGVNGMRRPQWRHAYQKLQIWRFTQYAKLMWLDIDAIVTRSMDSVFDLEPTWGQRDAWLCSNDRHLQDWLCSGLMLIKPSEETYQGLLKYAEQMDTKWWANGDQRLIHYYFKNVVRKPVKLLDLQEAAFGKCLGIVPNVLNETPGETWNMPAFVHKSSVHNECFYFIIAKQLREVDGRLVNICHYHPLGQYWRDLFCDALRVIGTKNAIADAFCDDFVWYRHR